ncbi:MAG: glycosyl transferase, group 1 [Acidobacteriales bacterium]|nr:glycosyl transferase, group 1 [Terriglobales bacterium]
MHVLVTTDTMGGVWTYTRELVTGLSSRGVTVTLVSFGEIPTSDQTAWLGALPGVDFRPTAFRLEWMQDSEDDLAASAEYLLSIVADTKPDLLHLNQFYYGDLQCDVPRIVVAHSDVVSWWMAVHHKAPPDGAWMRSYRATVSRGLAGATMVAAPSHWMLDSISNNFGTPKFASVVYNGRTPTLFNPHLSKHENAISVGRLWDFGKNAALLNKIKSPFPIYLAGNDQNPDGDVVASPSGPLGLHRHVYMRGVQSEAQLRQLYARASIYIATSQYEPFGLAPLEAALSRCAIVASDIPSFREIWGGAALYFRNNDPDSLQELLAKLHAEPELRTNYGNRALQRATSRYACSRMVDEYMALYQALMPAGALAA